MKESGNGLFKGGKWAEARAEYEAALDICPEEEAIAMPDRAVLYSTVAAGAMNQVCYFLSAYEKACFFFVIMLLNQEMYEDVITNCNKGEKKKEHILLMRIM